MSQTGSGAPSVVGQRWLLGMMLGLTVVASVLALMAAPPAPLFELGNLVGPTTQSLLEGRGLTVCTEAMGTPGNPICFHAGRMPLASLVVALGIKVLGYHSLRVDLFKTIVFLLPVDVSIWLAWRRIPRVEGKRILTMLLLLLPFGMTAFLADVVNLQVEEGYAYSLLTLAMAILLFLGNSDRKQGWLWALVFAVCVGGLYLTKSSMLPAVAVLLVTYVAFERLRRRRIVVIALVLFAPAAWAVYQHHVSSRYSLGTSLDGINLHKGNNPQFMEYYPPPAGETIDVHDAELNHGLWFTDEWGFNDYHEHAALEFIETHPRLSWQAFGRKVRVFFFSVSKSGSAASRGRLLVLETVGLLIFRVILWSGILGAIFLAVVVGHRRRDSPSDRAIGLFFLALVASIALPYVLGFAYTRHVSVLIYPSLLMCCRLLERERSTNAPAQVQRVQQP